MATQAQPAPATHRHQPPGACARRHLWMHFTRMGALRRRPRGPDHRPRRGLLRLRRARQALPRRALGAVLRQRRPRPHRARRGGRAPGRGARLLHDLELRAPAGDRAGRAHRRRWRPATSTASSSPPAARRRSSRRSSSPRATTSSTGNAAQDKFIAREIAYHGTTLGALSATGHPGAADAVRAARPGRLPGAQHEQLPLARGPRPALGRRPDRGEDRVRGAGHGRRGDPRAGPERRRLLRAAGRLLPARARDLRPTTTSC